MSNEQSGKPDSPEPEAAQELEDILNDTTREAFRHAIMADPEFANSECELTETEFMQRCNELYRERKWW